MNVNRAREILSSPNNIEVTHGGKSIWISSIDPNSGKAFIKTLDGNNEHYQVPVAELIEQS